MGRKQVHAGEFLSPCLVTNSHIAWLVALAERLMNGCSKTEMSGKRPLL